MRYFVASMMLAAAAGTPALAQNAPATPILPDATILDVMATGEVSRVPDVATLRAGVVTQAPTAAAASAENAARMASVIKALRAAGIAPRDIATASVGLSPQYRYAENQPPAITGYQASNTVSVTFRDIAKTGAALDALVKAGANQIDGPQLSIDGPEAALDEARVDAVKRARARAELYAQAAGLRVDRIVSIGEQGENRGDQPRPPVLYARAVKADAATEMLPGETEVSATVVVRFLLK
ncbi:SIMPL domain-containing protein [Sphingomonas jeddahensis]|uniref:26 kDa periplasmic immunogenic protein n=1 Tax=Sphingomonas jeddahensis TaxID=1915074 RepID=A0A1V2EUE5_9SPHN|nr:SIMPL domain-containing protein [Sphingomonas jeddahensis]ONF96117.1 26 kDa periplasmic immunogenic protein precursor [Sphingomonas jeddahensis]